MSFHFTEYLIQAVARTSGSDSMFDVRWLRFDVHIESLCKKISKRIGILNRIKAYLPRIERILCNNSLIKPLILYCNVTRTSCCSHDNINKIFKLQKRCVRIILDAQQHHGTVDLFNI